MGVGVLIRCGYLYLLGVDVYSLGGGYVFTGCWYVGLMWVSVLSGYGYAPTGCGFELTGCGYVDWV